MKNTPPPSRSALRRLIILLLILVGVIIYSTGWRITGIDLSETQDEVRQLSLQRALSELLSPDLLDQDTEVEQALHSFTKGCVDGFEEPEQETSETEPYVLFSKTCGDRDDIIQVDGFNFHPNALARIYVIRPSGNRQPFALLGNEKEVDNSLFEIGLDGTFSVGIIIPNLRGSVGDVNQIEVEAVWPTGSPYLSQTSLDVLVKIIETVFLALMATTLAVPIAALLSFTAARNLMRQVTMPLGKVLVGFILLPIGFALGITLLGPIGELGTQLFESVESDVLGLLLSIGIPILLFIAFGYISRLTGAGADKMAPDQNRIRGVILNLVLVTMVTFAVGALGGVAIWLGTGIEQADVAIPFTIYTNETHDLLSVEVADLGLVTRTIGEIIELLIVTVAGIAGALVLPSIGTGMISSTLKGIKGSQSYVVGGVLGAIGGGLLMVITGWLGSLVPLFTVIPPVAAAALGAPLGLRIYDRFVSGRVYRYNRDNTAENTARMVVTLIVGAIILFLSAHYLNVLAIIARERIPEANIWQTFSVGSVEIVILNFVAKSGLLGIVFGGIGGAMAGTNASFPLGMAIYNTSRTILNILRSIEPLIMGIVFVIWVGAGPFAGMLALGLHSIAALGKLYSEQIENIDEGPIEAIEATGANRLQTIIYAVVPQIIPPYIAFTMYRWDINVRMSTIIGFVGGGGIGFLLQQQINLLRYKQAGVAVLAIAIVVSLLDYASASIRERIT